MLIWKEDGVFEICIGENLGMTSRNMRINPDSPQAIFATRR
jgi:hypothetical protein